MCQNSTPYKVGDIVYYMYNFSGSFPVFFEVTSLTKCCIKVRPLNKKFLNTSAGFGSFDCVPDLDTVINPASGRRGGLLHVCPDGFAYSNYYGHRFALRHWDGVPVSGFSA
jgi:hypothetical protein